MKSKRAEQPQILDRKGLAALHDNIIEKISVLDKLNEQFKVKQEHHFLRTFMGVLERMGNDLVLAQEAYRNIDIEIKRENYYQQISAELTFFKSECFTLKKQNLQLKQQLYDSKIDNQTFQNEINSIKSTYTRKCDENNELKAKISALKKKIKMMSGGQGFITEFSQKKLFATPDHRNSPFAESSNQVLARDEPLFEKRSEVAQRWIQTQQQARRKLVGKSSEGFQNVPQEEPRRSTRYKQSASSSKYRSTNCTSFRRRSQEKHKRSTDEVLFD